MAKDNEKEVLAWQNMELLSCDVTPSVRSDELPKYAPVIINLQHTPYSVFSVEGDGTIQPVNLFIIDYDTLTVHKAQNTTAKYANLYDSYLGRLLEFRGDGGHCLGRFIPKHPDYNIIVLR